MKQTKKDFEKELKEAKDMNILFFNNFKEVLKLRIKTKIDIEKFKFQTRISMILAIIGGLFVAMSNNNVLGLPSGVYLIIFGILILVIGFMLKCSKEFDDNIKPQLNDLDKLVEGSLKSVITTNNILMEESIKLNPKLKEVYKKHLGK